MTMTEIRRSLAGRALEVLSEGVSERHPIRDAKKQCFAMADEILAMGPVWPVESGEDRPVKSLGDALESGGFVGPTEPPYSVDMGGAGPVKSVTHDPVELDLFLAGASAQRRGDIDGKGRLTAYQLVREMGVERYLRGEYLPGEEPVEEEPGEEQPAASHIDEAMKAYEESVEEVEPLYGKRAKA